MPDTSSTSSSHQHNYEPWEGSSSYLNQGRHWSSALIWLTAALFGTSVLWAFLGRLDQTISVRGKLEPSGSVFQLQSPSSGVVKELFVSEGDYVDEGQKLISLDSKGLLGKRNAIEQTIDLLTVEASSLTDIISSKTPSIPISRSLTTNPVVDSEFSRKLVTARTQTDQIRAQLLQLSTRVASRETSLALQEEIATDIKPLFELGAISRNAYLNQMNSIQELRAEIASLKGERNKVIAAATSQLNSINRQIIALESELTSTIEQLSNRLIFAPISGQIFDLKTPPSSVVSASSSLLKIVPSSLLQANVKISNRDIGFIKVGQDVSVSVDSFPSGEFGYIQGKLLSLGSDSLPPDQSSPIVHFPATISLSQQSVLSGNEQLNLQSGMGITANIKLRSRPAISIVTDIFTRQMEGLKRFR